MLLNARTYYEQSKMLNVKQMMRADVCNDSYDILAEGLVRKKNNLTLVGQNTSGDLYPCRHTVSNFAVTNFTDTYDLSWLSYFQ